MFLIGFIMSIISGWMFKVYAEKHEPAALGLGVFLALGIACIYLADLSEKLGAISKKLDKNRP